MKKEIYLLFLLFPSLILGKEIALISGQPHHDRVLPPPSAPIYKDLLYDRKYHPEYFEQVKSANVEREKQLIKKITRKTILSQKLGKIKYFMLNGNLERAKVEILKIKEKDPFIVLLKERYLSIIYFLEGKFDKSLNILKQKEFLSLNSKAKTCYLKVLNEIIMDDFKSIQQDWASCKKSTLAHDTDTTIWFENMVQMQANKKNYLGNSTIKNIKSLGYQENLIKLYLKMALYMNQEHLIINFLDELPEEFFNNDEIRELMGHLYYRSGKVAVAFDFLEDLKSANAENIKGNIYLAQGKYELAYAQFKLALKQKEDSYNAIERALPLAWLLRQWNDGVDFTKRVYRHEKNKHKKLATLSAFYIMLNDYKKAKEALETITVFSKYSQPYEVNQLYSYVNLMDENLDKMKIYAELACSKLDMLNCWNLLQSSLWDNYSKTIKRKEKVVIDSVEVLNAIKQGVYNVPIDEDNYIDQRDIEELDEKLIRIKAEVNS